MDKKVRDLLLSFGVLFVIFFFTKEILSPVIFSAILAYIFFPIQIKLERFLGKRIAALTIVLSFFIISFLLIYFFAVKIYEIILNIWEYSKGNFKMFGNEIMKFEEEFIKAIINNISKITSLTMAIPKTLISIITFFFLFYYFLADRDVIIEYFKKLFPEEDFEYFSENLKNILDAILYGHFLTAIFQGILCFIFFTIFKAPYVLFFSIISFFLAVVGITPAVVYIPLGIYKILMSCYLEGVGIIASGIFIVSTIDNIIKPKIAGQFYDLHPSFFLISIIGGTYVFGFSGIFIGPIVFGLLKAVVLYVKGKG